MAPGLYRSSAGRNPCVGHDGHEQLHLRRREQFVRDLNRVPGFKCQPPDGAFYAWVDVTGTGTSAEDVCRILLEDAGVAAIPGAAFGLSGKDFVRFSFASSVANLKEAVERIMKVSAAWQERLATR